MSPIGSTAYDVTGALERIWEVVRALNRHVEVTAPWQLAKDEARSGELDRVLYDLADGLRVVAIALSAYIPDTSARILEALRQPASVDWAGAAYGLTREVSGIEAADAAVPAPRATGVRGMIDTHAHLDGCDEPPAFLVERARAVGVTRIVTVGTGIESCRAALRIAESDEGVFAALGIDPHQADSADAAARASSSSCSGTRRRSRSGRPGLDYFHDRAREPRSARCSTASSRSPPTPVGRSLSTRATPKTTPRPPWVASRAP